MSFKVIFLFANVKSQLSTCSTPQYSHYGLELYTQPWSISRLFRI